MHFDKKIGLALGVLLVGIVGALFFRNEGSPHADIPRLADPNKIDEQIADRSLIPYLTGIQEDEDQASQPQHWHRVAPRPDVPHWELPDFLKNGGSKGDVDRLANSRLGPPDPIPAPSDRGAAAQRFSNPAHNRAWQVTSQPTEDDATTAKSTSRRLLVHRVQPGDTLSGLAARYLGNAARFHELYAANRELLRSPHDLRPGMVIKIPQAVAASSTDDASRGVSTAAPESAPARNISSGRRGGPEPGSNKSQPDGRRKFVPFPHSPFAPRTDSDTDSSKIGENKHVEKPTLSQQPPANLSPHDSKSRDEAAHDSP